MQYKGGHITPQVMTTMLRIVACLYVTFPIYAAGLYLYHRPRTNWYAVVGEMLAVVVLLFCAGIDLRRARRGNWHAFSPWFGFFQICVGLALATSINATAGGSPVTYRIVMLLPALSAAILGDEEMIIATWTLTMAAIGFLTYDATKSTDATTWAILVWGSALAGILVSIHLLVRRFLASMHSSEALQRLASGGGSGFNWPEGLVGALGDIAVALQVPSVTALACGPDGGLDVIGSWPNGRGDGAVPQDKLVTEAFAKARPIVRDDWLLIPVSTAVEPRILLVAPGAVGPGTAFFGDERGAARTAAGLVAGMADRAALLTRLQQEVRSDALTGLANRRALDESLEVERHRHGRSGLPLSVVMIDLDHFKEYNDSYGHPAGDDLLQAVAHRLRSRTRAQDVVARYGGEEFLLVLPETDLEGAESVVADLRLDGPIAAAEDGAAARHGVTFSAGVAQWDGSEGRDSLLERADEALYRAKAAGRNRTMAA